MTEHNNGTGGALVVKCPQCGKEHVWSSANRWRPFCSERCKQIDLGAWANEEYRVPSAQPLDDFAEGGDDFNGVGRA